MNVASGYGVAGSYGNYGAEKTLPANSKPFTIPILETPDEKSTQKNKNGAVSTIVSSTVSGTVSLYKKCDYNPFKDMAKTGNVNLPEYMQTKTTPTRSDEEILKDMEELAKEHARTGEFHDGDRYFELLDEYISSVSPDRASILKKEVTEINERLGNGMANSQDYSMNDIFRQIDSQRKNKKEDEDEKEPIDYLLEVLRNKGKNNNDIMSNTISELGSKVIATRSDGYYTAVDIDCGGGRVTTLTYDCYGKLMPQVGMKSDMYNMWAENGVVRDAQIFDSNGDQIMTFNGNRNELSQRYTKEEEGRLEEMLGTYNAAYDAAYGRHLGTVNSSEAYKEAYNSTYEKLTSGSVA